MNTAIGTIIEAEIQERVEEQLEEAVAARMRVSQSLINKLEENCDELLSEFFKKERALKASLDSLREQENALNTISHVAFAALTNLNEQGIIEFLLIKDQAVRAWWEENK